MFGVLQSFANISVKSPQNFIFHNELSVAKRQYSIIITDIKYMRFDINNDRDQNYK